MKNLILASAIALSSIFAFAGPSQAQGASVTITTGDGPRYNRDRDYRPRDRDWRPRERMVVREDRGPRHRCFTKKTKTYRHGKMVVKTTRVCR